VARGKEKKNLISKQGIESVKSNVAKRGHLRGGREKKGGRTFKKVGNIRLAKKGQRTGTGTTGVGGEEAETTQSEEKRKRGKK